MLAAPLRPAAMASMAVSGPVGATSPPANTAGWAVARVSTWVLTAFRSISTPSRPLTKSSTIALADGEDDGLAGNLDEGAVDRLRTPPALLVGLAQPHALQLDAAHLAAGAEDLDRGDEVLELDLLGEALLDLLGRRRHLAGAPIGDGDLGGLAVGRGETGGAASRVEGHVAAADDDDAVADRHGPPEVELTQELTAVEAAVEVVALGRRGGAGVEAGGEEDGLVAAES